jgi:hypothetical protein
MAIRPSRQTLAELNNARENKKQQLAQAYAELGGRNTALTPNYASNNPVPTASIPKLEKAVVSQYEQAQNSGGIQNITNNMKPDSILNLFNLGDAIRGPYGNAVQENAQLYDELKNNKTKRTLESIGQADNTRAEKPAWGETLSDIALMLGGTTSAKGINYTPEMQAAGITRGDLYNYNRDAINEEASQRRSELVKKHPIIGSISATLNRPMESAEGVLQNLGEYATGRALSQTDRPSSEMRDAVNENINSNIGRIAYGGVNSISDMALAMLLAGGNPTLSSGIMGLEKANDVTNDANARGLTPNQILAEGALSGVSTALTERLPMGRFANGGHIAGSMLSEGVQEGAEDIVDTFFDELVTKLGGNYDKSSLRTEYNQYLAAGYTPEEAQKAVEDNYEKQLGLDVLLGGITGGLMQGGSNLVQGNNVITGKPRTQTEENIPTVNAIDDVPEDALQTEEPTARAIPSINSIEQEQQIQNQRIEELRALQEAMQNNPVQTEEQIPTVTPEAQTAQPEVKQNVPSLDSVVKRAERATNNFLNGFNSNVLGMEELGDLRNELLNLGRQNPEAQGQINNLWQNVVNTIRGNQTAQPSQNQGIQVYRGSNRSTNPLESNLVREKNVSDFISNLKENTPDLLPLSYYTESQDVARDYAKQDLDYYNLVGPEAYRILTGREDIPVEGEVKPYSINPQNVFDITELGEKVDSDTLYDYLRTKLGPEFEKAFPSTDYFNPNVDTADEGSMYAYQLLRNSGATNTGDTGTRFYNLLRKLGYDAVRYAEQGTNQYAVFPNESEQQTETAQPTSNRDLIQQGRDTRNLINLAEQYKAKLSSFGNKSFNSQIDNAITALRNGDPNAAENLNTLLTQIDEQMNGETVGVSERALNQDMYDQMKNVTDGRVIHISPETLRAMDMNVTELNNKISTGTGRLRFVTGGGTPIDSVYQEMYDLAGGMLPEPRSMGESDMVDAIVKYMTDAKSGKNNIVNESTWNDVPLEETRSSAVVEAQNISDALVDRVLNGEFKNRKEAGEALSNYVREMTELGKKYPDAKSQIADIVAQTDREVRNSQMDADVREAKTPQDIDKSLMKYNLQFLSDVDEDVDTDAEDFGRVNTGREAVRQTYSNTESKNMTEQERTLHEQDRKFLYNKNSEQESMEEATHRLLENGFLKERKRLFAKEGAFNNVDVDEMMKLHKHYSDLATDLEAQGKDATKEWQIAADIFNKLGEKMTDNATGLQALAKWSRNTPEGLLAEATSIIKQYEKGVNSAKGTPNLTKEIARVTKRAKQMDANFMREFMKEANNLFTGSWEDVKNVTDGQTIHITRDMLNALGYEKLNDLNNDVFTNTSNSIRFTTKSKEGSSLRDSYIEMQKKAPELLADPTGMNEEQMLRTLVSFIQSKGQTVNFDSQGARHTMAKLGAMVNEQMPPKIAESVTTLLMDNMLGNIRTLLTRNAGGNIGFNLVEDFIRSPLTGFIDNLVSKKTGTRAVSGLTREGIDAGVEGFKEGLRQEFYDFKNNIQSARTGENTLENAVSNNRNNVFDFYWKGEKKHKSKILQTYNKLVKAGLSIGDRPFYEKTYKRSIAEYNKLYEQGLIRDSLTGKVIDKSKFDEIADMYAKYNALQAVYQDDSTMAKAFVALKEGIGEISEGIIGADILSQFSMPFVKTPANIITRSIEYSPLGLAKNIVTTLKEINSRTDSFNQARFSTELARNIIGTGLFALGMYAAQAGALTGGYSDDKDMKQAQKEAGMQEYALHTPIGDFDISWLPVLGNNAVAAAAAYDKYNNSSEGGLTALGDGLTAGVSSQLDTSALQGLQRLVGGSGKGSYDSNATLIDNARNTLMTGLSQFVPSLARQTAAFLDPNQRQLSGPGENDYYRNNILNGIPGLRQTLEPKIGRTGEELEQNPGQGTLGKFLSNFISPATWTQGTVDPVRDEAMRLYEATGNNVAFQPTVTMGELRSGDHIPTAEEYTAYQREAYSNMNQIAQQMINSDYYATLTDGDKENVLAKLYKAVKDVAKVHALGTDGSSLSGASKVYANEGADALLEYVMAGNVLSEMGMQNNDKNRDTVMQALNQGGADALTQMVQQSQELEAAGLNTNMQFKYDHATNYIPSLTPTDFADIWTAVNTDNNSTIKQDEIIAWLNQNPTRYDPDTALMYWRALDGNSGTAREWASIPILNPDTGLWEAKKP